MKTLITSAIVAAMLAIGSAADAQISWGFNIHFGSPIPPPPAPRHEVMVPQPFYGAVWIGGYWNLDRPHHRYVWVPGYWRHPYYSRVEHHERWERHEDRREYRRDRRDDRHEDRHDSYNRSRSDNGNHNGRITNGESRDR